MSGRVEALRRLAGQAERAVREGRFDEGEGQAREVLRAAPRDPHAHFVLALSERLQQRPAAALAHLANALRADRANPHLHALAAECHDAAGNATEALAAWRRALQYRPDDWALLCRVGHAERSAGNALRAVAALERAVAMRPDAAIRNELALALVACGRKAEAVAQWRSALDTAPDDMPVRRNLAKVLYVAHAERDADLVVGRDEALAALDAVLARDSADAELRHLRAALAAQSPPAPPPGYVEAFFDRFAGRFEDKLAALEYRAPEVAAAILAPHLAGRHGLVVDLGCGTGLAAPILRPAASRLVGVDLSAQMLAKARDRGLYDELVQAEGAAWIAALPPASTTCILALDVFIYVGALEAMVTACAQSLEPGGLFAFSLEDLEGPGYALRPTGRYAHGEAYVRDLLGTAGLECLERRAFEIRKEAGAGVPASFWLCAKAAR